MSFEMYRQQFEGESFNDLLAEQVQRAPWFLISIAMHVMLFLLVRLIGANAPAPPARLDVQVAVQEPDVTEEEMEIDEHDEVPEDDPTEVQEVEVEETITDEQDENPNDESLDEEYGNEGVGSAGDLSSSSDNDAIGTGGGAGGGPGRGRRRRIARCSTVPTQKAVDKALDWLAMHQGREGAWDADGFNCSAVDGPCRGTGTCQSASKGRALHDVGVSGLALLAFLGAGETATVGNYKTTVNNGLRWLRDQQDAEGCFGPRTDRRYTYGHAIATLAMTEAYQASNKSPRFKELAQKGIDYIIQCQNPYKAWRYGEQPGENDTSVTGWMVMALKSAKEAGLRVPEESISWAMSWIAEMTDEETGRVGYAKRGEPPVREEGGVDPFPSSESESLTAVAVLCRIFSGQDPAENASIRLGAKLMEKKLPVWDQARGSIDEYYWYYGTLAMYQVGGRPWEAWNSAMTSAIVQSQRHDGGFAGSWDPIGAWGEEGGRVYSTAMLTMCLEVYYRYGRVFGIR